MSYVLNSNICDTESVLVIILITSHAGDLAFRNKIREMFPSSEMRRLGMRRAFLLGRINKMTISAKYLNIELHQLQEESHLNSDIIMGDFMESYKNLTYKHLMGLDWVTRYCQKAQYVFKQDDDITVDYYQIAEFLTRPQDYFKMNSKITIGQELLSAGDKFVLGKSLVNMEVIRDVTSKWFVPIEEYRANRYPPFVSGWGYFTTPSAVWDMIKLSHSEKYFWIDDVHITGTLREKSGVPLIDMSAIFTHYKGQMMCCLTPANAKSKHYQPFWCDFLVGPTNDDMQLLSLLQQHSRFCHTTKTCVRRNSDEELNKTCVVTDVNLQGHNLGKGKAVVQKMKL
ncbi:unnamed protein product [Allacma fusca]|uniref:Hexosyltransferase n=1 Tax=Allacma fusca TaxID=39272 RepID=A0A8J2K6V3_9HEXA|nr:unnamed protein product [Allacma fusca]